MSEEKNYLVYFELHTKEKTIYIHAIIPSKDGNDLIDKMREKTEKYKKQNLSIQAKGVLGIIESYKDFLKFLPFLHIDEVI